MRSRLVVALVSVVAIILAGAGGFYLARSVQRGPANIVYFPLSQIGYSIGLSLEVVDITRVQMSDKKEFVQFTVRPWNGKTDRETYEFFQKYATHEFKIVLPADSPAAATARIGDILNCFASKGSK
jgi:hypothetical protein